MNLFTRNRPTTRPWPLRRHSSSASPLLYLTLLFSLLFFLSYFFSLTPDSLFLKTSLSISPNCPSFGGQKFIWYAPHSGFSNQLTEFKNALLMAAILNRTLVVPPVLDHHAVALGSCPKFRVLSPDEIRISVWNHTVDLIRSGSFGFCLIHYLVCNMMLERYSIRFDIDFTCYNELDARASVFDRLQQCRSLLSGMDGDAKCSYAVNEDCRTTVWTYQNGNEDGALDSFQPDEQLKRKKKISYVRKQRDVYNALGPGSEAESAILLAFGSLFTAPYKGSQLHISIPEASSDRRIQTLIDKIEFLRFAPEIISAGKKYAYDTIKAPFLCAQLRLLDGQFKNHWNATFFKLKQTLDALTRSPPPIHIFVMTDLPESNWTGTYLGELVEDLRQFKLFFLKEKDELIIQTAKQIVYASHGLKLGTVPKNQDGTGQFKKVCPPGLPDVLLYIEQTICSCASLGFVGTAGSTIADIIESMRKFGVCSS
ncbi:O-fucosyltransferase 30 isoform X2 [Pyrus x bretschneideri]|uniref:O-fucosyltransferase 30 isoform X2 n=1 Tax=Pyrus x bretschneideri TaxID=225117 RepID=UPI002030EBE3|nr:O-fucosyltransferase 30 isoform X2 [Pyrus x bretschneideri]